LVSLKRHSFRRGSSPESESAKDQSRYVQSVFNHDELSRDHGAVPGREPVCRQPCPDARRLPRLSSSGDPQHRPRDGDDADALGMPPPPRIGGPPVTNIRNTSSPHWRGWLKPENRCLVPFNSFAEYAPDPNPETKKKDVVWFALDDNRPRSRTPLARAFGSSRVIQSSTLKTHRLSGLRSFARRIPSNANFGFCIRSSTIVIATYNRR
jgi:hypothetical protein